MRIGKVEDLNENQLDFLKEISNIASGNAVTSLSEMLNARVDMSVPCAKIIGIQDADKIIGGPENAVVAILAKFMGELEGMLMLVFEVDFAKAAIQALLNEEDIHFESLSFMQQSALLELGNIMISSYVNAINSLANVKIKVSVPMIAVDMVGSLLSVPLIEEEVTYDKVIFLGEDLNVGEKLIKANLLMFPTMTSLNELMARFGMTNE